MRFIRDIINEKKRAEAEGGGAGDLPVAASTAPESAALPAPEPAPEVAPETTPASPFGTGDFGPAEQNLFTEAEDDIDEPRAALASELRNAFLDVDGSEEDTVETEIVAALDDMDDDLDMMAKDLPVEDMVEALAPEAEEARAQDDVAPEVRFDLSDLQMPDHDPTIEESAVPAPEAAAPVAPEPKPDPLILDRPAMPPRMAETVAPEPVAERPPARTARAATRALLHPQPRGEERIEERINGSDLAQAAAPVEVPAPAAGRGSRRAGRVKTRLLGFNSMQDDTRDPFAGQGGQPTFDEAANSPGPDSGATQARFPVGWLVVIAGPGRGAAFALQAGVAQIGRGQGQTVRLDFGDTSISRENHAAVAYDAEQRKFYLGHGGKANLVRLNDRPVLSTEELQSGHLIRLGETTLRFVGLCGADFDWDQVHDSETRHASFG